jgi:hypothetical protein
MAQKAAKIARGADTDLPTIEAGDPIPTFESERDEADFWDSHELGQSYFATEWEDDPRLPPPGQVRRPISVRFDASTIARLKRLAAKKGTGYQTLLKEFVIERLYEEEKREGIIPR